MHHGVFSAYPPSGDPFPCLPAGWLSYPSRSYGHYYFVEEGSVSHNTTTTYYHPTTEQLYRVTPQEFVRAEGVSPSEFVRKYRLSCRLSEFESWLADQRLRNHSIETEVRACLGVSSETEIMRRMSERTAATSKEAGGGGGKRRRSRSRERDDDQGGYSNTARREKYR